MKLTLKLLCVSFLIVWLTTLAAAQGAATGDVHVSVKDPTGKAVTNATVVATDQAKGAARTAPGDSNGEYRLIALPPGQYTVTVSAPGFAKSEVKNLGVTVGLMADLPITLSVAGAQEVVTVNSEAELVETSRSSTTDTIDQRRIDNLPINGRNYINFTLTDSQVVRDNAPNIGAAPTSGLNMSGQRARANLVNVDGADAIDNSVNGVRSTVSQEAVQEFQILTNGYAAEYGRASGGVVNIITRSGSNAFHGDVYGYIRNRNFQATNPFSNVSNPAYTRVQAGTAFGGPIKKDKAYYYFSYEVTRRHETGFSSIGQDNFGLVPFNTGTDIASQGIAPGVFPLPFGTIQVTPEQGAFLRGITFPQLGALGPANIGQYVFLLGTSSGMAVNGAWPALLGGQPGFPTTCLAPPCPVPSSFLPLAVQAGNFPIFEGTSLYSLRLDHNLTDRNRIMLRGNVSPSTVTGIEVNGENQTFGQNAFSRTSQQTYRDVAITAQDTWALGNNRINEFRFQFARRGLSYFFSDGLGGSNVAVNIPGFGYFGREPYSFIDRVEKRYQFTDNFSWTIGRHDTKFGVDYNYIPVTATFTVNYGGVYNFGALDAAPFVNGVSGFPQFSPVQAYGLGVPSTLVQGIGNPHDNFKNQPLGLFWQDSWHIRPNLSLNYGLRYDIEFPPKFAAPTGLALAAYNQLGLQKGIQTDKNNFQPRVGLAWDPHGDGKSVFRASYGLFYDHPLLGLYFLGDASDGSKSGQLLFPGGSPCNPLVPANPLTSLNASNIFLGTLNAPFCLPTVPGYLPNEQRFDAFNANLFLNQNYLAAGFPLAFQPFGYPQAQNFTYAYSHQANLTFEHDLGHNMSMSVAYNFNGGRHLNRPINANTPRGDLLVRNWQATVAADPTQATTNPLFVTGCGVGPAGPFIPAALVNFFRPSGLNASVANAFIAGVPGGAQCVGLAQQVLGLYGLNANCDPTTFTNCVPFSDMDANYSNGSSVYHGLTANLRKRFGGHTEFLASYTWSHAIDDSTDLQSPLAPQDSFFPSAERSNSLFDQRHRFVFSGVYQTGRISGDGFASKLLSNWTFAPIVEVASGRPFNIITGNPDNFQFSPSTGRPNVVNPGTPPNPCGPTVTSTFSPTGFFQEPCFAVFAFGGTPTLQALDGNLARNAGVKPWTVFNDLRVSRRIYFGERVNLDLIADMFNIANRFNVADVNQIWTNAGQPTASYDPRQFQFAMKVNW
jgi:hypothetical protein